MLGVQSVNLRTNIQEKSDAKKRGGGSGLHENDGGRNMRAEKSDLFAKVPQCREMCRNGVADLISRNRIRISDAFHSVPNTRL